MEHEIFDNSILNGHAQKIEKHNVEFCTVHPLSRERLGSAKNTIQEIKKCFAKILQKFVEKLSTMEVGLKERYLDKWLK